MANSTNVNVVVGDHTERLNANEIKNCLAFKFYQSQLRAIGAVRIEWENLPDNIDEFYIGQKLLEYDMGYFKDEILDKEYLLPANITGDLDPQGIAQRWQIVGENGYTRECSSKDSVLIRCTPCSVKGVIMTPMQMINFFAEKLAEVDRTISTNLKRQKLPWILSCEKKLRTTIDRFFKQLDYENAPYILVDNDFQEFVKVLNTQAPLIVPQLYDYKKSLWQEALTFLGVTNTSIEKRERLTTSEVEANNDGTVMMRYLVLAPYQQAVKKINKMFNRDISIKFRDNVGANLDGTSKVEESEVEEDAVD